MDEEIIARAMRLAIQEAQKGLGRVFHNPPVGCVILSSVGDVIATGYHHFFGGPHAEVDALSKIIEPNVLKDATVVVTLEPCAHEGKTPSCAKTLAKLPFRRLVYGLQDPNPLVAGQGAKILRQAGKIAEEFSSDSKITQELEDLTEIFLYVQRYKMPFVALKAGISANNSVTTGTDNKWITGPESLQHVHYLRSQFDAVLVGVQTVLDDNPQLNIRLSETDIRENHVVILDPQGKLQGQLASLRLFKSRSSEKIVWVVDSSRKVTAPTGVIVLELQTTDKGFDLNLLLKKLFELNLQSIFVEGGARTFGHFLESDLVNRIFLFQSPDAVPEAAVKDWRGGFNGVISPVSSKMTPIGRDQFTSLRLKNY